MDTKLSARSVIRSYAVVLLAPLLLLGPLLIRGQVLFWGTPALQFVPWWVYAWRSLQQGSLPLWNSLNGMGAPLLANYQSAFFYPPNWFLLLCAALGGEKNAAAGVAFGFTVLAVLHLAWAGLGMALLLRRLRFRWLGQVIGGLAYGLSGYTVARLGFFSMVWVAAWLPWVLYFTDQIAGPFQPSADRDAAKKSLLHLSLTGSLAMQLLAGHAQLAWYSLLLAGAWVTVWSWLACPGKFGERARRMGRAWLVFGIAALLAAGIAALQLVPTFEYLRQSPRADAFAYQEAMTYSFWPWRFLTLFAPDFFGSPASGDFWGYASYWEDHLYLGITPLLLAVTTLWLLVRGLRRSRRGEHWSLLVFLWASLVVTFVLALGRNTPVFPFLYQHVPTFAMFQAPARYLIWAAFGLPLLTAVAVEHWRSPTGRGLYWFRLGTAGAFAITLGAGLAYLYMRNINLTFIRATALAGVWSLGFGLLTLVIPYAQKRGWTVYWQGAVVAWTLLDLLFTGWTLNPSVSLDFYSGPSSAAQRILVAAPGSGLRVYLSKREEYDLKFQRFLRFKDFTALEDWRGLRDALIPDLNLLDRLALVSNFDPLVPERYTRWMTEVETLDPADRQAWLASAGVGIEEHIDGNSPQGVRFDPVANARRLRLFACAEQVKDAEEAWKLITSFAANAQEHLVIEGGTPADSTGCKNQVQGMEAGTVQTLRERPDELVVEVNSPRPGWLYLADAWYPGWQVTIDGQRAALYPANYLFRAVAIPSGNHQVLFSYRPIGFYFGGLFSILVMLFILTIIGLRGRK